MVVVGGGVVHPVEDSLSLSNGNPCIDARQRAGCGLGEFDIEQSFQGFLIDAFLGVLVLFGRLHTEDLRRLIDIWPSQTRTDSVKMAFL